MSLCLCFYVSPSFSISLPQFCVCVCVHAKRPCGVGTDNHLLLWDLRPVGITGSKMEKLCDRIHITLNKNTVPGDRSALSPGGVRIGAPALTTRGFKQSDFVKVADFLDQFVFHSLFSCTLAVGLFSLHSCFCTLLLHARLQLWTLFSRTLFNSCTLC
jgi:Serine hydroxymethyltransferase